MVSDDRELGENKTCFIVGPIGSRQAPRGTEGRTRYEEALQLWENVFEPACEQFGLSPIRADKIADPGEIPEQIFQHLRDSDLVIADVTGGNANVMYELGLRHTRDRATVQIGEYARLPFDINTVRTIQFRRSEGGLIEARDALIDAIRAALSGTGKPVTATRLWNELAAADPRVVSAAVQQSLADDSDEPVDEPGFMDVLAEGEIAMQEVSEILTRATAAMEATGTLSRAAGERLAKSDAEGRGFGGRLQVARQLAKDLQLPADELGSASTEFLDRVDQMDAMMQYIFRNLQGGAEDAEGTRDFAKAMLGMVNSAEGSEEGVRAMLDGAKILQTVARDLKPVGKSIEVAINRILQGIATITDWGGPLQTLFA